MGDRDNKLISCILPKGVARQVLEGVRAEHGITSANVTRARGMGKLIPLAYRGLGEQLEKEILRVVVPAEIAEDIFAFIYDVAQINRPHGGLMYMSVLGRATHCTLPDVPNET